MSEIHAGGSTGDASPAGHSAADWLSFAAAPTFATMALLTLLGGAPDMMMCSTGQEASPLGGMVPMYLLMSAFHLGPWLKQVSGRRRRRE